MVDLRRLEIVSEKRRGAGTLIYVTSELFRLPIVKDVMEITTWEPPRRMDVVHRGQFHGTGQFLLSECDGGTSFAWIEEFRPPLGALGEAAFRAIIGPHLRRMFTRSMTNVKRLAESHAAAGASQ
jgi:hypothetical protein